MPFSCFALLICCEFLCPPPQLRMCTHSRYHPHLPGHARMQLCQRSPPAVRSLAHAPITKGSLTEMHAMVSTPLAFSCSALLMNPGAWSLLQVGVKAPGTANSTTCTHCTNSLQRFIHREYIHTSGGLFIPPAGHNGISVLVQPQAWVLVAKRQEGVGQLQWQGSAAATHLLASCQLICGNVADAATGVHVLQGSSRQLRA